VRRPRKAASAALLFCASTCLAVEFPERGTDQIAHLCIVAYGGAERWSQVRDVRYTLVSTRYMSGNRPVNERSTEVFLRYHPRQQCRIESATREGRRQVVIYDGEKVRVQVDGREDATDAARRRGLRSALSTLYLFALPFNIREPGVTLTYRGQGKLDGRDVYRLQASVRPGGGPSPADTYEFLIDTESFQVQRLVYNIASEAVTYVVRWSDVANLDGILRPARWDYLATEKQKALTYEFRNLKLNSGLPDPLFSTRSPKPRPGARPSSRPQSAPGAPSAP